MSSGTRTTAPGVVAMSAFAAVFMIAQQIASKAVRDGFFLSVFDVTALPVATLGAALLSVGAALVFGKFIATFSPAVAVPVLFAVNGVLFFIESSFVTSMPQVIAGSLYLHTAAFGGAVVSGFWSVINERFDPYTARRVMGRIAGGATFGGVLGGALTWAFSDASVVTLLAAFGVSSFFCAAAVGWVGRDGPVGERKSDSKQGAGLLAGFEVLAENSYPRMLGMLVCLGALMTGTVDYVFKAGVAGAAAGESLVGFFAVFYTVVGVITFLLQAGVSGRVLKVLGVVPTVGAFPVATVALVGLALLVPGLWTVVALRGGAMLVENSLYRSGYELLYTPLPLSQKRSAKVLIDLGFDRLGTAAASGLALLAIAIGVADVNRLLLLTGAVVGIALIATLAMVRQAYVGSLARRLRDSVASDPEGADGAQLLAATFMGEVAMPGAEIFSATETHRPTRQLPSRDELLDLVHKRVASRGDDRSPPLTPARSASVVSEQLLATPLRERLRDVESGDPGWQQLRQSAPGTVGQLGDILLSSRESVQVRMRAAELLSSVPSARTAATLLEALEASEFRLRRAATLALLSMCSVAPGLRPDPRVLSGYAVKELRRPSRTTEARTAFELSSTFYLDGRGNELAPTLELVFLLLAICGESADLRLALSAITDDDPARRGTGLEYLDNLLPGHLRARLLALAEHPELTQADLRVPAAVVDDLAGQLRSGAIDVHGLRARFRRARKAQFEAGSARGA